MSLKLPKLNFEKTRTYDLPIDYVVSKFYEFGYKVTYNQFNHVYQSCCPICREGKSWGKQKRCYYIPENKNIFCHNCGSSMTPFNWISKVSSMSYEEIWDEIKSNDYGFIENIELDEVKNDIRVESLPLDCINLFDNTQIEYYKNNVYVQAALKYITDRRLDKAINKPDALYVSLQQGTHKNRLVIPFKNDQGKIVFYQSRRIIDSDEPKYLSKFLSDKSICGLDKVSEIEDTVFIFEGPIDSFFIRNGIGLAGITEGKNSLTITQEDQLNNLKFFNKIWVLDSQWLDNASRIKTKILLEQGEQVFIWPKKYGERFKDINEMCTHYNLNEISPEFVKKNSTHGKSAIIKYKMLFKL